MVNEPGRLGNPSYFEPLSMRKKVSASSRLTTPTTLREPQTGEEWRQVAVQIEQYRKRKRWSLAEVRRALFDNRLAPSQISLLLKEPERLGRSYKNTKDLFLAALQRVHHEPCAECSFYDQLEEGLTQSTNRHAFQEFEGDYLLYRFADDAEEILEYEATMFACLACARPRMRWLLKGEPKHQERHGHVFVLYNRFYVIGISIDRLLLLNLSRPPRKTQALTGIMLNKPKDDDFPIAMKVVLCCKESWGQPELKQILPMLQNESTSNNILKGWKRITRRGSAEK